MTNSVSMTYMTYELFEFKTYGNLFFTSMPYRIDMIYAANMLYMTFKNFLNDQIYLNNMTYMRYKTYMVLMSYAKLSYEIAYTIFELSDLI